MVVAFVPVLILLMRPSFPQNQSSSFASLVPTVSSSARSQRRRPTQIEDVLPSQIRVCNRVPEADQPHLNALRAPFDHNYGNARVGLASSSQSYTELPRGTFDYYKNRNRFQKSTPPARINGFFDQRLIKEDAVRDIFEKLMIKKCGESWREKNSFNDLIFSKEVNLDEFFTEPGVRMEDSNEYASSEIDFDNLQEALSEIRSDGSVLTQDSDRLSSNTENATNVASEYAASYNIGSVASYQNLDLLKLIEEKYSNLTYELTEDNKLLVYYNVMVHDKAKGLKKALQKTLKNSKMGDLQIEKIVLDHAECPLEVTILKL